MSIKGFPAQKKLTAQLTGFTEKQSQTTNEFVTAQPTSSDRVGLDSVQLGLFRIHPSAKTATPNATHPKRIFTSAAHGAKQFDVIRFEDTATNANFECGVLSVPDANTIILSAETPLPILGTDTFFILRFTTPRYDSTGATIATLTQGPVIFVKNAVNTNVTQSDTTPTTSEPLPVVLLNPNGTEVIAATEATLAANGVLLGPVTETAPATDTASSGLNGRLQRVAQRLSSLITQIPATLGQKTSAASLAVVIASDQSEVPVRAGTNLNTSALALEATQAVHSLLFGSNTETAPATDTGSSGLNGRLQRIAQRLTSLIAQIPATLGQKASAASLAVTLSSEQEAEIGAITETAPATDTASSGLNGRLQRIAQRLTSLIALLPASLGQKTSANSLAVVLASDQSSIPVTGTTSLNGKLRANAPVRNVYSTTAVTTAAYTQLVASLTSAATEIEIFDSSGETLVLAFGAAAAEVDQINIFPGGNGRVMLAIPAATRISVKAVSANASVGELNINFLG